jgi:glutaminyl-tRNA synthetase
MANKFNGRCNLRFDDSNPTKEIQIYIDSIESTVKWLGFEYGTPFFASDYFDRLYEFALELIKKGRAYVCSLPPEKIREYRGTLTQPGKNSPYRDRSIEENLDLFSKMKNGNFDEGTHTLRAKIDMSSPNINLRDPVIYRIKKAEHPRTGKKWCIYPMYDFTHCLSDAIEGITHSLCSLEFEDHRPLYDWILDTLETPCHPQQIEFARMNINYTILSKRKLQRLVDEGHVTGWDDPRLPTLEGMKRRGYTPDSIRKFCDIIGVSKKDSRIDVSLLENCLREDLNIKAPRVMGVLRPLKVTIENYPEGRTEKLVAKNHPKDETMGTRPLSFSRTIYIDRDDFMENPPKKFFRLGPGREVRLRYAYFITCKDIIRDENGNITELICTYDPETRGGDAPDGRKVKGTIHWVDANECISARIMLYDRLFMNENPEQGENALYGAARLIFGIELLNAGLMTDSVLGAGSIAVTELTSVASSRNAIPDRCEMVIDRRLTLGETASRAISEIQTLLQREGVRGHVETGYYRSTSYTGYQTEGPEIYPVWLLPQEHPLLKQTSASLEKSLGRKPVVGTWTFSTDGVYTLGEAGIPTIGFGPGDDSLAHTSDENIPLTDVHQAAQAYANLAIDLLNYLA